MAECVAALAVIFCVLYSFFWNFYFGTLKLKETDIAELKIFRAGLIKLTKSAPYTTGIHWTNFIFKNHQFNLRAMQYDF